MTVKNRTTRRTNFAPILRHGWAFTNTTGSLRGIPAHGACVRAGYGWLNGDDYDQWVQDRDDVEYVVLSYDTPIAWRTSRGWHVVAQKFSATTSCHQGLIRRGLADITG